MEGVREVGIKMTYVKTNFTFSRREHTCQLVGDATKKKKKIPKKFYISRVKAKFNSALTLVCI